VVLPILFDTQLKIYTDRHADLNFNDRILFATFDQV
jgi:hypothetical protein